MATACSAERKAVFDAKRAHRSDRSLPNERRLEAAGEALVAAAEQFFALHAGEFESIGMPAPRLTEMFGAWTGAWLRAREFEPPRISPEALIAFGPVGQALLGSTLPPELESRGQSLYSDEAMAVTLVQEASTLMVVGSLDAGNAAQLQQAMEDVLAQAPDDFHLDLGGLTFCDLVGLTAMIRATEKLDGSQRLIIHGLPPYLHRAMSLVGWVSLPRIVLVGSAPESAEAGARGAQEADTA